MARVLHRDGRHLRRKGAWWRRLISSRAGRYRAGAEGEARVAAVLDRLSRRFYVLHDVGLPGRAANLDHVVVGPRGVFVVETKYYAAEVRGRAGKPWRRRKRRRGWRRLLPGGWTYIHDPTAQARRGAHRLEARLRRHPDLEDALREAVAVRPLVVFAHPNGRVRVRSRAIPVVGLHGLRRAVRRRGGGARLPRRERRRVAEAVLDLARAAR